MKSYFKNCSANIQLMVIMRLNSQMEEHAFYAEKHVERLSKRKDLRVCEERHLGPNYFFLARVGVFVKTENIPAKQHLFFTFSFIMCQSVKL